MTVAGPEYDEKARRYRSNGRRAALGVLDAVLEDEKNMQHLRAAFEVELETDAVKFFREVVMPLIPQSMKVDTGGGEDAEEKALKLRTFLEELNVATAGAIESLDTPIPGNPPATGAGA